jgi:hypothetical protein
VAYYGAVEKIEGTCCPCLPPLCFTFKYRGGEHKSTRKKKTRGEKEKKEKRKDKKKNKKKEKKKNKKKHRENRGRQGGRNRPPPPIAAPHGTTITSEHHREPPHRPIFFCWASAGPFEQRNISDFLVFFILSILVNIDLYFML